MTCKQLLLMTLLCCWLAAGTFTCKGTFGGHDHDDDDDDVQWTAITQTH
jgi:hypothetical protein